MLIFYPIAKQVKPESKGYAPFAKSQIKFANQIGDWASLHLLRLPIKMTNLKLLNSVRIPVTENAPFDLSFKTPLAPIIFSHGVCAQASLHSGHLMQLASQGYIVFAIDHNDRSNMYTQLKKGSHVTFDTSMPLYHKSKR